MNTYGYNEARPCPGRTRPLTGRRATAVANAGTLTPPVPRGRSQPPLPTTWLPRRERAALTAGIRRRNALDRALATARGLTADDPRCARFQGSGAWDALDREVAKRRRAGAAA